MLSKFETARKWETILDKPTSSRHVPLDELYSDYCINTSPKYQRGRYRHDEEFASNLLHSIIISSVIMPILLYKLQPSDILCNKWKWEAIDGVHRLTTIKQYMAGKYIQCEKGRQIMPYIFHEDSKTHIFYQKTEETEEWANHRENKHKRISYMTPEEMDRFNRYELQLSIITTPLTLDQRRQEFLKIQHNLPVKNNDLYKNYTQIPIVKIIMDNNIDEMFYEICKHLDKDITQYVTQWIIRFWLISKGHLSPSGCMDIKDSQIKSTMLEVSNCTALLCSTEKHELFIRQFERFHHFFGQVPEFVKFSPVAIYAIFNHLCNSDSDKDEILMSHIVNLYTGETKDERKMWEPKNTGEQLANYFNKFSDKLNSLKTIAPVEYLKCPRKMIPKKVRDEVWKKHFDTEDIGKCFCCNKDIFQKGSEPTKTWNCGHVISDHDGGETTIENMRPVCFTCNQQMKTENMMVFKSKFYPQT
jgi:hypothetical protein